MKNWLKEKFEWILRKRIEIILLIFCIWLWFRFDNDNWIQWTIGFLGLIFFSLWVLDRLFDNNSIQEEWRR